MNSTLSTLADQQHDVRELSHTSTSLRFHSPSDQAVSTESEGAMMAVRLLGWALCHNIGEDTNPRNISNSALTMQEKEPLYLHNMRMLYFSHSRLSDEMDLGVSNQRSAWLSPNETKIAKPELDLEDLLVDILNKLFRNSLDETFEDGMDSSFGDSLNRIVLAYGKSAIHALRIVMHMNMDGEVVEEALRQIGRMKDARTHYHRLVLLEHKLASPNSRTRDAALIGIESMDDPAAISSLQRAISREKYGRLQQNIKAVLVQLQNAQ